ncbi:MAG: hypothetical protein AAF694_07840 [Bacteroidota bacterium]
MSLYLIPLFLIFFTTLFSCNQPQSAQENSPIVTAVYPSSDTLPENLLRMYIQFSAPMKTTGNLERIQLIDQWGNEVKGAIFNNVYELWDSEQKQLTLLFDPGRVKTGLIAHETMGRALKVGHSYQLRIKDVEDIHHQKLAYDFKKKFFITKADTVFPDLTQWKPVVPPANGRSPLILEFPQMIDQMSLRNRLVITHSQGKRIPGSIQLGLHEQSWKFTPKEAWKTGEYLVYVNSRLEDPAGNNINGLFDHKIGSLNMLKEGQTLSLSFSVK